MGRAKTRTLRVLRWEQPRVHRHDVHSPVNVQTSAQTSNYVPWVKADVQMARVLC